MAALTDEEHHQVHWLLAPWLVGAIADFVLQGFLFLMFLNYFTIYRDDKPRLKIIVWVLFIGTTLKSMHCFLILWMQYVVYFGDVAAAVNAAYTTWYLTGAGIMTASVGIYVQTFFLFRLYSITKWKWLVIPIAAVLLFAYICSICATYYSVHVSQSKIGLFFALHLSFVFGGDFLLASSTAWALLSAKGKHALKQTNDLIQRLILLTWQTMAPAALCAMCNLIFSQIYGGEDKLVSVAFNTALPKLYAMSMMWTLNARRTLRYGTSSGNITSSGELTGRSRARRDEVELNRFGTVGTVHIRTDIETLQYIDETRSDPAFTSSKGRVSPEPSQRSLEGDSSLKAHVV